MKLTQAPLIYLVLLVASLAAHGQSLPYLSNIQGAGGVSAVIQDNRWSAQRFVTGTNAAGYWLDSVTWRGQRDFVGGELVIWIFNDGGGRPGTRIGTLTGPSPSQTFQLTNLTHNGSNIILGPAKPYWVVCAATNNGQFEWQTKNNGSYSALEGWSIASGSANSQFSTDSGGNWSAIPFSTPNPLMMTVQAHPMGTYFHDFSASSVGATTFSDGSLLLSTALGAASVQDSVRKDLQLTAVGVSGMRSAYLLPDLNPTVAVHAFSAKWNTELGGSFPNAGDGFSFNFGSLGGLDLTSAAYGQEAGYGNGLTLSVQTSAANNPGFYLRVNNRLAASLPYTSATQWGVNNNSRHYFEVDWHYINGLTVRLNGQTLFSNVTTYGFVPEVGQRFVWAARTGSATEELRLDNIVVVTGGTLSPVAATSPFYKDPASDTLGAPPASAFDGNLQTFWATYAPAGYVGATLSSPQTIRAYSVTSPNVDDRAADPKTWALEWTDNGGTNWNSSAVGGAVFVRGVEQRAFLAGNSTNHSAWRLNVTQNNGNPAVTRVGEVTLWQYHNVPSPAWSQANAPGGSWNGIACSADGSKLAAVNFSGPIYRSTDSAANWSLTSASSDFWTDVVSSADGTRLSAVKNYTSIHHSTNSGVSWSADSLIPQQVFHRIAYSSDGLKMAACMSSGQLWTTTNGGKNWAASPAPSKEWTGIASSADGTKLYAVCANDSPYLSTNSGGSWTPANAPFGGWLEVATSSDGSRVVGFLRNGSYNPGALFVSTNAGASWTLAGPRGEWNSLAVSSDGNVMVAGGDNGVALSTDGGATWAMTGAPGGTWKGVACSADGGRIYAAGTPGIWSYTILPSGPAVTTQPATPVSYTTATLRANIKPHGLPTTAWLTYGLTTNYGNTVFVSAGNSTDSVNGVNVSSNITGLTPGTLYHFRAYATNTAGTFIRSGDDLTFTTAAGAAPSVTTKSVRDLRLTSATLYGEANPNQAPTAAWLQWGTTTNYGSTTALQNLGSGSNAESFNAAISGLAPGTLYHFRAVATNVLGTNYGADLAFITPGTNQLDISSAFTALAIVQGNSPFGEEVTLCVDNVAGTKYVNFDKVNAGLLLTPADTNRPVRGLTLISTENLPERDPASFWLEGSFDGISFTTIASNNVPPFPARNSIQSFAFNNETAYPRYRLTFPTLVNSNADAMGIAEIELLTYAELTAVGDPISIAYTPGSTVPNATTPVKLFDHLLGGVTDKMALAPAGSVAITITPAAGPNVLKGLQIVGAVDDLSLPGRTPAWITVAGSMDGTNFSTLGTFNPLTPWANLQMQDLALLGNTNLSTQYRVTISSPPLGGYVQLGELRLFGEVFRQSVPAIGIRPSGPNVQLFWPDAPGLVLERNSTLSNSNWTALTNPAPVLVNGTNTVTFPPVAPVEYFRLRR